MLPNRTIAGYVNLTANEYYELLKKIDSLRQQLVLSHGAIDRLYKICKQGRTKELGDTLEDSLRQHIPRYIPPPMSEKTKKSIETINRLLPPLVTKYPDTFKDIFPVKKTFWRKIKALIWRN